MTRETRIVRPLALGLALSLGSGAAQAARLDYTFDAGVERNDNIALTAQDRIERTFLRAGFGFLFEQDSSAIQSSISGRADYRDFRSDHYDNDLRGDLSGHFNWVALPQRLHFSVDDSLSVQTIDSLAPDAPSNQQQINVLSLGPTLFFRLGPTFRGQAELRFIDSTAEVTDEFNSRREAAAFRAIKDLDATSLLSFNLQGQRVHFTRDDDARDYDRYEAFARYARTLASFDVGIEGGYSELRYRGGDGSRSEPLLRGNARWRPSPRSQLELVAASLLSDAASDALSGLTPGAEVPDRIMTGNTLVTSSAYRERRFDLDYTYTGTLLTLSFGPYLERRNYLDDGDLDQDLRGARANLQWRLQPTLAVNAFASQENTDYTTMDRIDKTRYFGAGIEKRWSRHWSSALQFARYERTSSLTDRDIRQNSVYLSMTYRNR
jgi:hypothetical protein